jgi:hypothetical protein
LDRGTTARRDHPCSRPAGRRAGATGLEPAASSVRGRRSTQPTCTRAFDHRTGSGTGVTYWSFPVQPEPDPPFATPGVHLPLFESLAQHQGVQALAHAHRAANKAGIYVIWKPNNAQKSVGGNFVVGQRGCKSMRQEVRFCSFMRLVAPTVGGFHRDSFIPTAKCPSHTLVGRINKERSADTAPQARMTPRTPPPGTYPAWRWP